MGTPSFDGSIQVSIHALPYDSQAAADAIFARPQLVRGYADSLMSGVWPSHDILPVDEQMASGQPLSESSLHWPAERGTNTDGPNLGSKAVANQPLSLGLLMSVGVAFTVFVAYRSV